MEKMNWVVIALSIALIGCATHQTKTRQDPFPGAVLDAAAAKGGSLYPAIAVDDDVSVHLNSELVRTTHISGFNSIAQPTIRYRPKPKGALNDFGFKWGATKDVFGIGLGNPKKTDSLCRWELAPKLAIVPNLRLLKKPAFTPDQGPLRAFGVSLQVALQYRY